MISPAPVTVYCLEHKFSETLNNLFQQPTIPRLILEAGWTIFVRVFVFFLPGPDTCNFIVRFCMIVKMQKRSCDGKSFIIFLLWSW